MKNLTEFRVVELSENEMRDLSGGWIWIALALVAGLVAAGAALIDYIQGQNAGSDIAI